MTLLRKLARGRIFVIVLMALWIPSVGYGLRVLLRYANTPGPLAAPPDRWPTAAGFLPSRQRAALVMFVHPECPCSRATIGELAKIMARSRKDVEATVFFYDAGESMPKWTESDLWKSAAAIPGVRTLEDRDAVMAGRFGARTSGQTLLYDRQGQLTFNGGITTSRGHAGDNDGSDAIIALLSGKTPSRYTAPVFGCAIRGE